jgi:ubiquinone/menaquinone biosynthesis C-methylase UbiE
VASNRHEPITSFGEATAEVYDEHSTGSDPVATVAFLERLAGGGPVLELAIGTGRIASLLAARGIMVDGIDFSPAMVAKLRAKPGGEQLAVTIGDFAEVRVRDDQYVDAEAVYGR